MINMRNPFRCRPTDEPDPRLTLALELAARHRDLQVTVLTHLRDRSFALLEIVFLGAAIVFAFGASERGRLSPWMVILLLIALGHCMAVALYISLPSSWKITNWRAPWEGQQASCPCTSRTMNECMAELLADAKEGMAKNAAVLDRKRYALYSMFGVLAALLILAVIFWVTLGTG
ncbi:hypothetical protein [Streptomyces sp. NPDC057302]|uniref:hypothetical protein n=1 Tax=Streptomyces sp. NPDC057302 TaxID=3346094 RepID=UPI0036369BAC